MVQFSVPTPFYEAVSQLVKQGRPPRPPEAIEITRDFGAEGHLLSMDDEIDLAEYIAFLAQVEDGPEHVSAAIVEEHGSGLILRVASNETIGHGTRNGFSRIRDVLRAYAGNEGSGRRQHHLRVLFEAVLDMSMKRIRQRILARWTETNRQAWSPGANRHRSLLMEAIERFISQVETSERHNRSAQTLLGELRTVLEILRQLRPSMESGKQRELLKKTIIACSAMPSRLAHSSVESYVRERIPEYANRPAISCIDKVGTYYTLCKNLLHLSRKPRYRQLFSRVEIEAMHYDVEAIQSPGASQSKSPKRRTHAEMKLVAHLAVSTHAPSPRYIGTSKRLCFLCGLFIRHQNKYRVSGAHNEIYRWWAFPCNQDLLEPDKAAEFGSIADRMTKDMTALLGAPRGKFPNTTASQSVPYLPVRCRHPASDTTINTGVLSSVSSATPRTALPAAAADGNGRISRRLRGIKDPDLAPSYCGTSPYELGTGVRHQSDDSVVTVKARRPLRQEEVGDEPGGSNPTASEGVGSIASEVSSPRPAPDPKAPTFTDSTLTGSTSTIRLGGSELPYRRKIARGCHLVMVHVQDVVLLFDTSQVDKGMIDVSEATSTSKDPAGKSDFYDAVQLPVDRGIKLASEGDHRLSFRLRCNAALVIEVVLHWFE